MKVGKAIYNILSQSTDVQSNFPFNTTDYSPTGTELVTNGDFSATGGELITNGDFSVTGSELAVALTSFTSYTSGTSTITFDGSTAELNIDASNSNVGIYQDNIFALGTSYKIVLSMKATASFDAEIVESNSAATINAIGTVSLTTSYQDFTFYYVGTGTYDLFIHRLYSASGGASQTISIETVSVKELGADWTVTMSDGSDPTATKYVQFVEAGARFVSDVTAAPHLYLEQSTLSSGKLYKFTCNVAYTDSGVIKVYVGGESTSLIEGVNTIYSSLPTTATTLRFLRNANDVDCIISNVSVQELGEGWNVQEGWSIGEDKAICDGSTNNYVRQVLSLPVGNLKVTFEVDSYTSGTLNLWANLPAFTTIIQATSANTYEAYITTTSGANNLYFYSVAFVGSFTNVTVEEMVLNKIFPELAPPDIDAPYVVYSVVSNSPSETKNTNGDIDTANIEVYGFQDTYNKAVDLGVSVRAALDRKTGTYNTIEIQSTNYVNEQMDVNEARKLWAAIQDYTIRIKNI